MQGYELLQDRTQVAERTGQRLASAERSEQERPRLRRGGRPRPRRYDRHRLRRRSARQSVEDRRFQCRPRAIGCRHSVRQVSPLPLFTAQLHGHQRHRRSRSRSPPASRSRPIRMAVSWFSSVRVVHQYERQSGTVQGRFDVRHLGQGRRSQDSGNRPFDSCSARKWWTPITQGGDEFLFLSACKPNYTDDSRRIQ